ncbi:MAG: hypothetical protein ACLU4N_03490 [Butyricimonas faecihominis]
MRYLKRWGLFRFGWKRWWNSCILAATILKRRGYGRCIIYRAGGGGDCILVFAVVMAVRSGRGGEVDEERWSGDSRSCAVIVLGVIVR